MEHISFCSVLMMLSYWKKKHKYHKEKHRRCIICI